MLARENDPKEEEGAIKCSLSQVGEEVVEWEVDPKRQQFEWKVELDQRHTQTHESLLQQSEAPFQLMQSIPVPEESGQGDDGKESLHREPDLCEAAVLVDSDHADVVQDAEVLICIQSSQKLQVDEIEIVVQGLQFEQLDGVTVIEVAIDALLLRHHTRERALQVIFYGVLVPIIGIPSAFPVPCHSPDLNVWIDEVSGCAALAKETTDPPPMPPSPLP